jgi:RNA polymerase sigma-70 factor, ECF subfamily
MSSSGAQAVQDYDAGALNAALAGDGDAFAALLAPFRNGLMAQCYRMLGSVHDAEDALQEVSLRAWRGLARYERRSSLRSWLHRIAINTCLTAIEGRRRRVLPMDWGPAWEAHDYTDEQITEPVWLGPLPDQPDASVEDRERVELAFVAALQHLPPNQRATLIMRDVLGFSAEETGRELGASPASVHSALQRARRTVASRVPPETQQTALAALGDRGQRELVESYVDAMQRADVPAILKLLTEDASWSMPPHPSWYQGKDAIGAFLAEAALQPAWRRVATRANGQLAVAAYSWDEQHDAFCAHVLDVLSVRGSSISAVCGFVMPDVFGAFGLPPKIAP